jgi:hypothetical protein
MIGASAAARASGAPARSSDEMGSHPTATNKIHASESPLIGGQAETQMKAWSKRAKIITQKPSAEIFESWKQNGEKSLKEGSIHRGIQDTSTIIWSPEQLILTHDRLFIAHPALSHSNSFSRKHNNVQTSKLRRHASAFSIEVESHGQVFDDILLRDVIECELKEDKTDPPRTLQLIFRTEEHGYNCGRSYIFRSKREDVIEWDEIVDEAVRVAKEVHAAKCLLEEFGQSKFDLARARTKLVYESPKFQYMVAFVIAMGFIQDVLESLLYDGQSGAFSVFWYLEACVTLFYFGELLINVFVHSDNCFRPFYMLPQNWIDLSVVIASVISLILTSLSTTPAQFGLIKMVRVVRVLNLAKYLKEFVPMYRMVKCLMRSVVPLLNAFVLLMMLTIMYAVMGTAVLGERSPQYFGNFQSSIFSLFQVLSGDSWASQISREIFHVNEEGIRETEPSIGFFFISYYILGNIVLLNVVIAVLLDEFLANVFRESEARDKKIEAENAKRRITGCLDCLSQQLTGFDDASDLIERIDAMYDRMDSDKSGGLNFEEFKNGIKNLPGIPSLHMTENDYARLTEYGKHLSPSGELTKLKFRDMMQDEFWRYSQRQLTNTVAESKSPEFNSTVLMLKMLESRMDARVDDLRRDMTVGGGGIVSKDWRTATSMIDGIQASEFRGPSIEEVEAACQPVIASAMRGLEISLSRQIALTLHKSMVSREIKTVSGNQSVSSAQDGEDVAEEALRILNEENHA